MTKFEYLLIKLRSIDPAAAEYVERRCDANYFARFGRLVSLFSWSDTPQGYTYWQKLHIQCCTMPNITKLGNCL